MPKREQKPPTNPLPCGCGVLGRRDLENAVETGYSLRVPWKDVHVKFCPLHAAAGELLEACRGALATLLAMQCDAQDAGGAGSEGAQYPQPAIDALRRVIDRADGR